MKKILFTLIFLGTSFLSQAQANKQDVKTFLELSGHSSKYNDLLVQVSEQLTVDKREAFKKDLAGFIERIIKNDVEKYAAEFSQDEIVKLIEFYKSPLGKKLVLKNDELSGAANDEAQENKMELQGIIMKYMM